MNLDILEEIGLTKAESLVYFTLVKLGQSTSGKVIELSGLQSSVVHRALKSLIEKGFASYVKIGKDKHYRGAEPSYLLSYIDEKKQKVESIIPELQSKYQSVNESLDSELLLGKKAIFNLLLGIVNQSTPKDEYLSFSLSAEHEDSEVIEFYEILNARRQKKKLSTKVLANIETKAIFERHYSKDLLKKAKVKYTSFNFPQGIVIWRNKVILLNWQNNPSAVVITSSATAIQFKKFFENLYRSEKFTF